jgi:hypothetical protein
VRELVPGFAAAMRDSTFRPTHGTDARRQLRGRVIGCVAAEAVPPPATAFNRLSRMEKRMFRRTKRTENLSPEVLMKYAQQAKEDALYYERAAEARKKQGATPDEHPASPFKRTKPYDAAKSGAVRYPMYFIEDEHLFGLRWAVPRTNGDSFRTTMTPALIDDVVLGLADLCDKFSETSALPPELRRKLGVYQLYLKAACKQVEQELAGKAGSKANGRNRPAAE